MTKIAPFRAIRPVRDKVHLIATRPYYSYKKNVLSAKLESNPFSFLHIINPEFGLAFHTKANTKERFDHVRMKYAEFLEEGILKQDENPHIYIYRQTKDGHEYTGIIAGASVEEYENDLIKKHEATLTSREEMFTNYLDVVGYNAEPVLLSYPHNQTIDDLLTKFTQSRPENEFTTTDRIKHELWLLTSDESVAISEAFKKIPTVYIADGHHRSVSSALLKKHRSDKISYPNEDYFLAFFIDENRMKILEFNRLVKTLNNLNPDEFLDKLSQFFEITTLNSSAKPTAEHNITMCLDGNWYLLICNKSIIDEEHPVKSLDAEILTLFVLTSILGIEDLKTDKNIEFISGAENIEEIERKISEGDFRVGFILYPVSMDQLKKVADNHLIMPPKSTWVEPKLRSGLTIYNINE